MEQPRGVHDGEPYMVTMIYVVFIAIEVAEQIGSN